jgi:hypothetical protein
MEILFQFVINTIYSLFSKLYVSSQVFQASSESNSNTLFGLDLSIESLRSQKFSTGIFVFLIFSLVLFSIIIYVYLPKEKKSLKTGEKIMFGAIIIGMVLAVIIGWLQLVDGYLM